MRCVHVSPPAVLPPRASPPSRPQDEQRLELLKEIGGTRVYEERRRESTRLMEECQAKRTHIEDLVRAGGRVERRAVVWGGGCYAV